MKRQRQPARRTATAPPGRVRIVAGKWRGRWLPVADVAELRPTSERIRETLFNWLAPSIEGARCLDLFAGTGVLGLEALSRGAAQVQFVEHNAEAAGMLRESIGKLGAKAAAVHAVDARAFLGNSTPGPQDVVFLDPPYSLETVNGVCALLDERGWLARGARVYLEQDARKPSFSLPAGWAVRREKKAGNVRYRLADVSAP